MFEKEFKHEMGTTVHDLVTGFSGTITGMSCYLTGSNHYLLTPRCDEKGQMQEQYWFEEDRLLSP